MFNEGGESHTWEMSPEDEGMSQGPFRMFVTKCSPKVLPTLSILKNENSGHVIC